MTLAISSLSYEPHFFMDYPLKTSIDQGMWPEIGIMGKSQTSLCSFSIVTYSLHEESHWALDEESHFLMSFLRNDNVPWHCFYNYPVNLKK